MALLRYSPDLDPVSNLLALQGDLERFLRNPGYGLGVSGSGGFPPVNIFDAGDGINSGACPSVWQLAQSPWVAVNTSDRFPGASVQRWLPSPGTLAASDKRGDVTRDAHQLQIPARRHR